ncbi:hypothetical protein [Cellulomonas iranensis]|uniref:hypothetical protein n=1 Tax=Cellulomonas iranensis TaxID=76862 RepID=UPI003D7CF95E
MWFWGFLASGMALVGTVVQARSALAELVERDPLARSALAVDEFAREVPRWRLVSWLRHRRLLEQLKTESPAEASAYRRVWAAVWAWSLLATSALVASIGALLTPIFG